MAPEPAPYVVEDLVLSHGRLRVIDGLNLTIPQGQLTAIVGPNGCGKSTLLAGLSRLHTPTQGKVWLQGQELKRLSARDLARRIALLPQEASAPEGLSVNDLIRFGRQPHQSWYRQWSEEDQAVVAQAIASAGLQTLAERGLETLSGGQRQRAWIAMTIAQQTPIILLDEPTSALDLGHQLEVFELLHRLVLKGRTIIMVVHDLTSACRYADHLVAMRDGKLVAEGKPQEVVTPALVRQLYDVDCSLVEDPLTGKPLLAGLRRSEQG
ncbi:MULTISPECIES: ABC transporter ATP-binding protein [Halomonas]|uniref:ABC transporter ATP-binding protein n=1 Tax=Halomonas TaxID=2745 RepID=UPI001A8F0CAB|nr:MULTISPECIES: ABC transporter ATP-binding protein [Halomonas]MED5295132.1 ABC transporter ATP-binding protein [Pseudomonadota bacterium]MBN8411489.1 ABC transporter ATP-binding protein [Halomonas litopenaei]MBY5928148.1 ABC transporter ATP-binding protein [Halomonas sp. DP8Y7-3]MBY5967306.1 ABC transporter ATP-binding protein [Halomonas denitrificans]MBY6029188.1 ABC transporter ATP-binding protein [Halomonas sp. DP8Y7-1]